MSVPNTGIDGMFLAKIDVYFKQVSSTYGISMEIRTVENGFPTSTVVPGGRSRVPLQYVNASDDASKPTTFPFNSIPFLQTNTQYAFVLIPDGGNDEYLVWTGKLGDTDVYTNSPIFTNNQLGNLFISSNDLVWTPVPLENIKYDLYTANFTSSTANVFLRPEPTDFITVNDVVGSFATKEAIWISNSQHAYAQVVYNTTSVTVPNSTISDLAVNNWIYITTSDRQYLDVRQVLAAPNSTTITISSNSSFSNTACLFGRIAGDTQLFGVIKTQLQYHPDDELELVITSVTSNSTLSMANSTGQLIFGQGSRASAYITSVANKSYDSITPQINFIAPAQTAIDFAYRGYSNSGVQDSSYINADDNVPNEFLDNERIVYSKSNEVSNGSIGSNSSLIIRTKMSTSNSMTAPYIDSLGTSVTLTYNAPTAQTQLLGYYLNLKDVSGKFARGDLVTQGSNTGVVDFANNSYVRINSPVGSFTNTSIAGSPSGATANVTTATYFDETMDSGYYAASRYISKNVILADKQDAEDLVTYLTVYRPVNTQFNVYAKFLNGSDTEPLNAKDWSCMTEADATTALFSSSANRNDVVEIQFGLPQSLMVDVDSAVTSSSASNVTISDSTFYSANSYVYLRDNVSGAFNVRKVDSISNSTTLTLHSNPSFTSSNVTVGTIAGLQSQSGAFLYANNSGIIRYVTSSDVVYDSYKTFAVKIVPVSNNSTLIPIMKNMRSIALQI